MCTRTGTTMRIGLVGGTGKEGSGLGLRWAKSGHQVMLGSRSAERALQKANELSAQSGLCLQGGSNIKAIAESELVVVCVPYQAHKATFELVGQHCKHDPIVVDLTVPLKPPKVRRVQLPVGQSAALEAAKILGDNVRLVAGFHHVSSTHLANLDHPIECDVLICSDHKDARQTVIELVSDLGTRGLDAGVLANSIALESLTPLLIHMNIKYKSSGTGIRITGL